MSKIALVGEKSFIVTSVNKSITDAGYEVLELAPKMTEMKQLSEDVSMIIIYGGDYIPDARDALVYLNDFCVEHEIRVGILGYEEEFEKLEKILRKDVLWKKFERPFNVKELVEQLSIELMKQAEDEKKKHILVVDDSGTMLRTIKGWLSSKYKVSIASSAAMAISLLANNIPDLILLDYEMPVCNGPQFLEMIRAEMRTQSIPVIFLTAKNDSESVRKAVTLKPDGYLLKTMSHEELLQSIDEFFEKRKGRM